jgi:transcriptional regulator with XRE-family HTH domain
MHVMNETNLNASAKLPTTEQLVGRQVRLLRQGRGWSQLDVAEKMRPYGYKWSQATVTRLESATRPIRVNELTDLAMLFGVPVTQFLDSRLQELALDDLDTLKREIEKLTAERVQAQANLDEVTHIQAIAAYDVARIDGRLTILAQWIPRAAEVAHGGGSKGDGRE